MRQPTLNGMIFPATGSQLQAGELGDHCTLGLANRKNMPTDRWVKWNDQDA